MQSEIRQQDSNVVGGVWDWLKGRKNERQEANLETARLTTQKAQDAGLDRAMAEAPQAAPAPIQRSDNKPRPGEKMLPHSAERQRDMHDHPPVPQKPDQTQEATRQEYTRTPQPLPSMGSTGTSWVNIRATPSSVSDKLLKQTDEAIVRLEEPSTAALIRLAKETGPGSHNNQHKREDRLAAWKKDMTPEQQASFDQRRKPVQEEGPKQGQKPGEVPGQKPGEVPGRKPGEDPGQNSDV